jgi:hypothetical protein
MNNARNQSRWISGIEWWSNRQGLAYEFFFYWNIAQGLAIAAADRRALLTVGSLLVTETVAALPVGRQAIILQQDIKKVGRQLGLSLWKLMDDFGNSRNEGKFIGIKMTRFGIQGLGEMVDIWKHLIG